MTDQKSYGKPRKLDKRTMWPILKVWSLQNRILNCQGQSESVQSMKNTRHDNDVIDQIGPLYGEHKTELL